MLLSVLYFFEAQQGLASSHFFASADALQGVLHDAAHGLASHSFASAFSVHAAAEGHFAQSFDISVVAFFVSLGSPVALARNTTTNATNTIPDNPIIIFLILKHVFEV
jgi:hypothetical protein